ncbi:protein SPEAR1 isoform X2 [Eutrema salsugineum]|uniref:protein SPEAR1 isoform X2 n=1 Tax=Eutrema salsugineum TaxID=72664 RepID=UPI000CED6906|nr:protein SPEAR1 isoform X2 [Eutrema salsugineum]
MGSSFFGRPNMRGSSPSSSSPTSSSSSPATRRGKKNGSEKPKQPQRGLGVAQLEKIRLHGEMSCNSFNNYNPSLYPQMGVHGDQYERATMSWNPNYGILESQHSLEPNITRHFLHEDPSSTRRSKSLGSGNQNSGSSDNQELDLELRLSL